MEILGLQNVAWAETKGSKGYRDRLYFDHISIFYNGREDMGVWLDMSGQGCRVFESLGRGDFNVLFAPVFDNPGDFNITRLDVAYDDHTGVLDFPRLVTDTQELESGLPVNYITRYCSRDVHWSHKDGDERPAWSVEHGRKSSESMVRIYDKAAERGFFDRHWVRVELQLRRQLALNFAQQLYYGSPIGDLWRGVIYNNLRYVDDFGTDSNRWRWPMKSYWADLLEDAQRIRLYKKPGVEYNMVNLENFVFGTASAAIDTYIQIMGLTMFYEQLRRSRQGRELPVKYQQLKSTYYRVLEDK